MRTSRIALFPDDRGNGYSARIGRDERRVERGRNSTPQQVFDGMRKSFRAEKAKGLRVRYQFNLSGPNGGDWFIDVNDGKFKMNRGGIDNPDVTFIASDKDWVALSNGKLKRDMGFSNWPFEDPRRSRARKKLNEIFLRISTRALREISLELRFD